MRKKTRQQRISGRPKDQSEHLLDHDAKSCGTLDRATGEHATASVSRSNPEELHQIEEHAYWRRQLEISIWLNWITVVGATAALVSLIFIALGLFDNREALVQSQRAWLFRTASPTKTILGANMVATEVDLVPTFENTGNTPAFRATCWSDWAFSTIKDSHAAQNAEFYDNIGPRQQMPCRVVAVPADALLDVWEHRKTVYIWARTEYTDAFKGTPRRFTEICGELFVGADPRQPRAAGDSSLTEIHAGPKECNGAN